MRHINNQREIESILVKVIERSTFDWKFSLLH